MKDTCSILLKNGCLMLVKINRTFTENVNGFELKQKKATAVIKPPPGPLHKLYER